MRSLPTLALTASVGVLGLALAPAASAATPDGSVAYLAAQLEAGGDRLVTEYGGQSFDDLGLTIDAVLGMSAAGTGGDASSAATDYLVAHAGTYYGYGDEVYSAATAKLLTFASARGLDPRNVGGTDLVTQLQSLEQANGQFTDQSEYGDYSNTLGQSFGIIGLKRAGTNPSTASVDFLLAQQCDDGGFSLEFTDGCLSDPDATSTAVQALDVVGGHDAAIQAAADYLESRQDSSGGVGGGSTTEGSNANSTGLAAVAFRLAGRDGARTDALGYLDALTFGCDTPALAGAVAYNTSDFDAAVATGESAAPDGTITRSTAQALLGQTDQSYATVTSAGQTAATPELDCAAPPAPGDDTDAGSGDSDGTGTGT
ncbi:MAG: hypothetical protein L0G89_14875, partial [Janibacter sp.]|nr:hypothetical protein [Janibacter sp.]